MNEYFCRLGPNEPEIVVKADNEREARAIVRERYGLKRLPKAFEIY